MEQEMELEALQAILMDDIVELSDADREELRLDDVGITGKCYRIKVEAVEDAEPNTFPPGEEQGDLRRLGVGRWGTDPLPLGVCGVGAIAVC